MKTSKAGIELIKRHEGLRLSPYYDVAGVLTVGYGHTTNVNGLTFITKEQAEQLLISDLSTAENAVNRHVKVPLNQNQFDAMVSLVFNVGSHNIFTKKYNNGYSYGSTLANKLNKGDYKGASERFTDFVKAGGRTIIGLMNRRQDEQTLFKKKLQS